MLHVPTSESACAVQVYASLRPSNVLKMSEMNDDGSGGIKRLSKDCHLRGWGWVVIVSAQQLIGLVEGDGETLLQASAPAQHTSASGEIQYVVHAPSCDKRPRLSVEDTRVVEVTQAVKPSALFNKAQSTD
ncbi:hypothetical protein, variant 3 [Exophiala xenobiotica]|uniref:Uncharacterized protein n=1 Tax=Exophiala xenobiotica TaxID=348802 RepID=A0A0D2F4A1_9EURO|nr:hypothetical protein, variant 1 [Exophiala xenobiotica]XP_013322407.1 hypothetical protein, variant 3 [Exophiala xenobiotica]XP_013322408.1 hypothetical protein, variant 2 [Exophiala xenobiotica]XP_013322409.1 uncharacterized protein PV05_01899 [Exophiala xenobiotica]KIW61822.1 hypothetical protein PV05_01899 [Exophiala xenobiotica]KIW61823.1 hypothetical protein, variant 1 [Exophiala xenobiotica]KIW61824.1 hypothetical protein, variant 2 [Exophiala xenobiotica]KIW61825.1 hypothetical pro